MVSSRLTARRKLPNGKLMQSGISIIIGSSKENAIRAVTRDGFMAHVLTVRRWNEIHVIYLLETLRFQATCHVQVIKKHFEKQLFLSFWGYFKVFIDFWTIFMRSGVSFGGTWKKFQAKRTILEPFHPKFMFLVGPDSQDFG